MKDILIIKIREKIRKIENKQYTIIGLFRLPIFFWFSLGKFCVSRNLSISSMLKDTIHRVKRQPREQRNIGKLWSDKGLISRIHSELLKLNTKKHTNLKMGKRLE